MVRVRAPARGERIATLFKAVFSRFLAMLSMKRDFLGEVLQRNAPCRLLNRPRLWNESPLFRKKTPTFFEKSPSFSRKSPTFLRKSPTIFSVLSYVLNYTSSEGEREIMNFWGFRFDVLKRGSTLWLTSSELVRLQRSSIRWEPKKIPLIAGWMGYFYRSAQCWLPHQGRN